MNIATKSALLLSSLTVLFLLSACQQPRPSPDQTLMGEGDYESGYLGEGSGTSAAGGSENLEPEEGSNTAFLDDFVLNPNPELEQRETFGNGDQIRDMFESVYFEFDRSNIRPGERGKIEEVADYLGENPDQNILLEGYCDWRGTTEYNLGLGDRRATSVSEYLQNLGIPRDRIEVLSMGDLEATEGGTEAQMAEDRRVEFVILE